MLEPTQVYTLNEAEYQGMLLALASNIRLGFKWLTKANTLAYCTAILNLVNFYRFDPQVSML